MDLSFTPEEQAFREDIRAWVKANLPADIAHKVHNALRLTREDMQRWAKILGKKGWLGHGWPKEFGGPGWNAVQKHLFEEECALAGAKKITIATPATKATSTERPDTRHNAWRSGPSNAEACANADCGRIAARKASARAFAARQREESKFENWQMC